MVVFSGVWCCVELHDSFSETQADDFCAKLEPSVQYPPQYQWTGTERQPPPWTDELAEMSRHIYTRHGIGDGAQKPVFQVKADEVGSVCWAVQLLCVLEVLHTHISDF